VSQGRQKLWLLTGAGLVGIGIGFLLAIRTASRPWHAAGTIFTDPWGTPFRLTPTSKGGIEIRSAGPDKRFDTDDDIVSSTDPLQKH